MTEAQFAPHHTIDQKTGFIESNSYVSAFDGDRKTAFLNLLRSNSLGLYKTCAQLGLSVATVNKHYQLDPVFKQAYDDLETEYASDLESVSRQNAMNPKSVIERIFQLKALLPGRYADQKNAAPPSITISIDPAVIQKAQERRQIVEGQIVSESTGLSAKYGEVNQSPQSTIPTDTTNT